MVEHAKQHDQFVKLLQEHQGQLFGYILALVHNFADADDVFQLTSMVIWRKFHEFEIGTNFLRWGCDIARLEVLSFYKLKRRRPLLLSEDLQLDLAEIQTANNLVTADRRQAALESCLERVSPDNRRLLELCYGGGESIEQVSAELGRSKHSIYNSLRRIRMALSQCVGREFAREGRVA
jgi:RNA polymerase sigma-70 factor, ECF subfamily